MSNIGDRIIEMREQNNITQTRLSQIIGITKATMSKYENNVNVPNAILLGKIADALDTTTDYLVGRTKDNSPLKKSEAWIRLSDDEKKFMDYFKRLTDVNKIRVLERLEMLYEEQPKKLLYGGAHHKSNTESTIHNP